MKHAAGFAVILSAAALSSCTTRIHVPHIHPDHAQRIYLVDYGRHSSLIFGPRIPQNEPVAPTLSLFDAHEVSLSVLELESSLADHRVEYAYGEWWWYALLKDDWHDLFRTMILPTQGALGRRDLGRGALTDHPPHEIVCEFIYPIDVDESLANELRDRLDARFAKRLDTKITNVVYDMDFVHDDALYTLGHNCNRVVVGWLRELGCQVSGFTLDARFEVIYESE